MRLTEREIQAAIYRNVYQKYRLVLPNYTPAGWFECDVMVLTKAGYMREYEIKLSHQDFEKDAEKRHNRRRRYTSSIPRGLLTKHQQLDARRPHCPNQFVFVTLQDLVSVDEIPDWAGLVYATAPVGRQRHIRLLEVKKAPRLHNEKPDGKIESHARGVCYYRYWAERIRVDELRRKECLWT